MSAVMGIIVILFAANEVIVGIALNLFALGLTTYLLNSGTNAGGGGFIGLSHGLPLITFGWITGVPVLNEIINGRDPLVYASWLSVPLAAFILRDTLFGLRLRAVGESPLAARAAGVSVGWMKFASFLICGFFCGLAGVELSLGAVSLFSENMTSGRGIIAFAAVIFGGGIPILVAAASLLFGFAQALAAQVQIGARFPAQFVLMTPYILTMLALALSGERQRNWMLRRVRRRWGRIDEPPADTPATLAAGEPAVQAAAQVASPDGSERA
jgi:simple sugar transport system permease protein